MRDAAVEIVAVAGPEDALLVAHGHLEMPADNDAGFLALVAEFLLAGIRAGCEPLMAELDTPSGTVGPDQLERDAAAAADLDQLFLLVERLVGLAQVEREELRDRHRKGAEDLAQRCHLRARLAELDE